MKNKYLNPLKKFVIFFAVLHLGIAAFLTILTGNISYFNAFFIISLNELIPNVNEGLLSALLSFIFALSVYLFFYFRQKKR